MPCGGVLREALKYDAVAALILYDEPDPEGKARNLGDVDTTKPSTGQGVFWKFFDWIVKSSFEVCTDAFNTFRVSCSIRNAAGRQNRPANSDHRRYSSSTKK
jgi:calcium binding protein 39